MNRHIRSAARVLLACAIVAMVAAWGCPQAEAACSVTTYPINFGNYNIFSLSPLTVTGTLAYRCTSGRYYSILIGISSGAGTFANRQMRSGSNQLLYNLYLNSAYTAIWGDGTGGTYVLSASGYYINNTASIYGRVPTGQDPPVGSYSDALTVTINF